MRGLPIPPPTGSPAGYALVSPTPPQGGSDGEGGHVPERVIVGFNRTENALNVVPGSGVTFFRPSDESATHHFMEETPQGA